MRGGICRRLSGTKLDVLRTSKEWRKTGRGRTAYLWIVISGCILLVLHLSLSLSL